MTVPSQAATRVGAGSAKSVVGAACAADAVASMTPATVMVMSDVRDGNMRRFFRCR